ncbi:TatD family hydrolase [Lacipirellula limnantheis]|uniref:Putative deoxyribonuclease YcfH n=1 Tax=Lacipirellula limnantheis TaxID=2528024 RepID=A0A517TWQ0_9BACT|nr:TatD family hydrolase [Lacipirellula limnantheis]QDT72797.1 putative deoxyribonuclease YcfH [Lacipirellula limnantheis]
MPHFDTHAHLDQEEFDATRDAVVERARAAGVETIIAVGTTLAASRKCVELAAQYAGAVYAAVGLQPNYVAECGPDDWSEIERLAESPGVVAIGETGLDRHWDFTPFAMQQDYFDRHLALAGRLDLPFIVHMRDCDAEIMEALRAEHRRRGPLRGIMHSFTGDAGMAAECLALGLHISFAGMVTYKKSQPLRDCAATIPANRLLIETDCPYLSPEPVRGKRPNEPAYIAHTATCLAIARSISPQELGRQTTANARALFGISS